MSSLIYHIPVLILTGHLSRPPKSIRESGTCAAVQELLPSQTLFHRLPTEVYEKTMAHLDPVSQMSLGLISRFFHGVFHNLNGKEEEYNIRRNPFDLRMQVSECGKYFLNYKYEDLFLRDSNDIVWDRSLGELLWQEKTLRGDLKCCEGCFKYKPDKAYERCKSEVVMLKKHGKEVGSLEAEDVKWYESRCRKCRMKILLVIFEREEEFFDEPEIVRDRESLGLKLKRGADEKGDALKTAKTAEEWHAADFNYEVWEIVFKQLVI